MKPPVKPTKPSASTPEGDRIAKVLSRAGVASRREAERMIAAGEVAVNGKVIESPALNVGPKDKITVNGKPLAPPEPARLWLYYKPDGLVTSASDEKGRETVFDHLPEELPRVRRQALDVTAPTLGKDRVEGERTLAAAAHAGEHHQLVAGNGDVDVLEVVLAGTPHPDHILQRATCQRLQGRFFIHALGEGAGHPGGSGIEESTSASYPCSGKSCRR